MFAQDWLQYRSVSAAAPSSYLFATVKQCIVNLNLRPSYDFAYCKLMEDTAQSYIRNSSSSSASAPANAPPADAPAAATEQPHRDRSRSRGHADKDSWHDDKGSWHDDRDSKNQKKNWAKGWTSSEHSWYNDEDRKQSSWKKKGKASAAVEEGPLSAKDLMIIEKLELDKQAVKALTSLAVLDLDSHKEFMVKLEDKFWKGTLDRPSAFIITCVKNAIEKLQ